MGWFSDPKCGRCNRAQQACICKSVSRRHANENEREARKRRHNRDTQVHPHVAVRNSNVLWCGSCGCQVRSGRCVSATCGKRA